MESGNDAEALRDAEQARDAWAEAVVLPRGHDVLIGGAVAVQIATTVVGLAVDEPWALWALAGGLVLFGLVAAIQLWRFTRLNGVRVSGFASRVVFGTAATASLAEGVSLVAGYAAAVRGLWWLVALISVAGGVAYVLSGRRWLRAYRQEPGRFGAGESTFWLAVVVGLAVAGLVLLVLQR